MCARAPRVAVQKLRSVQRIAGTPFCRLLRWIRRTIRRVVRLRTGCRQFHGWSSTARYPCADNGSFPARDNSTRELQPPVENASIFSFCFSLFLLMASVSLSLSLSLFRESAARPRESRLRHRWNPRADILAEATRLGAKSPRCYTYPCLIIRAYRSSTIIKDDRCANLVVCRCFERCGDWRELNQRIMTMTVSRCPISQPINIAIAGSVARRWSWAIDFGER